MAGLAGRPTLVNVWASWCAPCRAEMPWLQRLADTGSVRVLGVDAEDESGAASALLDELGVTFPSVFDPSNSFARGVGVVSKPMSVLVDADGRIVKVVPGPFDSYSQLAQTVESELGVTLP
jgi:DsbE subfamily thiol:disulfide oxidoreductase